MILGDDFMNVEIIEIKNSTIAVVTSDSKVIEDTQSALALPNLLHFAPPSQ